jgi:hypothetical protein
MAIFTACLALIALALGMLTAQAIIKAIETRPKKRAALKPWASLSEMEQLGKKPEEAQEELKEAA